MEVTLRKTKITASILKQMQIAKINQLWQYDVLGYFVRTEKGKIRRFVFLKSPKDETYCIWQMFADGNFDSDKIKLFDEDKKYYFAYQKSTGLDIEKFAQRLGEIKDLALKAGQIFY